MKPFDYWSDADASAAAQQGWALSVDPSNRVCVRAASFGSFSSGGDAFRWVVREASDPHAPCSRAALLALYLVGHDSKRDLPVPPPDCLLPTPSTPPTPSKVVGVGSVVCPKSHRIPLCVMTVLGEWEGFWLVRPLRECFGLPNPVALWPKDEVELADPAVVQAAKDSDKVD